ncbi:uncharacterized protein LOC113471774 [Diaphorina citri]|uniref:Uncharacterized protein LOC113471774 n=1 Tax=Diaphorina citri TaxID=121845 RepID=A0A3Q0JIN4_DIACI|nr:uncharacterized protein LOC113471774 [Diaphorina citri]
MTDKKLLYLYSTYVAHLTIYTYIYVLLYVGDSLHSLVHNVLLYAMISYEVQYVDNVIVLDVLFEKLNGVLEESIERSKAFGYSRVDKPTSSNVRHYELWEICDMHWTLCQLIEHDINGHFSFRLLDGRSDHNLFGYLHSTARVECLEYPQDSYLANNTKNIVCEHLTPSTNPKIINQLKVMESQLSAHKADFDAAGIFELQRSFVAWMVGAITTYLVIFIQLQESSVWNIPKTAIW